jgi:hypothetical protein
LAAHRLVMTSPHRRVPISFVVCALPHRWNHSRRDNRTRFEGHLLARANREQNGDDQGKPISASTGRFVLFNLLAQVGRQPLLQARPLDFAHPSIVPAERQWVRRPNRFPVRCWGSRIGAPMPRLQRAA